jgi:uracil-DNA glycosylase
VGVVESSARLELARSAEEWSDCRDCRLAQGRTMVVVGDGSADADLMFVGEAPGANEDREGLPFVGQAGKLLDKLLDEIGLDRGQVFVANVLKCRPPGNRDPQPGEIESCEPYLFQQVELIEPLVVCTLGNFATKLLRGDSTGITRLHGQAEVRTIGSRTVRLFPLFHPAAALYTPRTLETLRADFQRLPELLAEPAPDQPVELEEVPELEPDVVAAPDAAESEPRGESEPAPQLGLF